MKKRYIIVALILVLCLALSGCECKHEWQEATCKTPKTCTKCEETEGSHLEHEWKDATCEEPKTCAICGDTQGEPMGHVWSEISCAAPVTCYDCGKTRGEALPHTWIEATCTTPKTCEVCSGTEGEALGHVLGDWWFNTPDSLTLLRKGSRTCVVCEEVIEQKEEQLTATHENGKFLLYAARFAGRVNRLMETTEIGAEYEADRTYWEDNIWSETNNSYGGRGLWTTELKDYNGNYSMTLSGYPNSQMYLVLNYANGTEFVKSRTSYFDTLYIMVDYSELGKAAQSIIPLSADPTFTMEESATWLDEVLNSENGMLERNGLIYSAEKKGAQLHVFIRIVQ